MNQKTYKAAIYRGIGSVEVVDLPYPECGDDEVIVKNLMSGICGADVNAYNKGGDAHYIWQDHEFGHEMVSEVVQIGKSVTDVKVGDYVFPHLGHAHRDRRRMATVGGFSEYIKIVQYEDGVSAFKMDKTLPVEQLAVIEPFVIGTRGAKNADPGPGKTAVVFGAGLIGISCALMLKYYGCDKVMVVDVLDNRLKALKKLGLETCNSASEDLKAKAIEVFGSKPGLGGRGENCAADVYVDCAGIQPVIDDFQALTAPGGTLVVVGVHHKPVTMNYMMLSYGQWTIKGCGTLPTGDAINDIMAMMKETKLDLTSLISHKFKLDQIVDALKMAGDPENALKVVIQFD